MVNAASAAVFHYLRGHGSSFFKDGPRLVLITFLASSALWAQINLIAILVDSSSASGCHVAIIFASAFDQLARLSLEQVLLWDTNSGANPSTEALIPQGVLVVRFILGGIFVGFQRPQFRPVCVTSTLQLPLGITLVVIDALFIGFLFARALSVGLLENVQERKLGASRSRAILGTIIGLGIWTAVGGVSAQTPKYLADLMTL